MATTPTAAAAAFTAVAVKESGSASPAVQQEGKPKKKICCACPETKKARDQCIVENGEDACKKLIEAHKVCLRKEGFDV